MRKPTDCTYSKSYSLNNFLSAYIQLHSGSRTRSAMESLKTYIVSSLLFNNHNYISLSHRQVKSFHLSSSRVTSCLANIQYLILSYLQIPFLRHSTPSESVSLHRQYPSKSPRSLFRKNPKFKGQLCQNRFNGFNCKPCFLLRESST